MTTNPAITDGLMVMDSGPPRLKAGVGRNDYPPLSAFFTAALALLKSSLPA